MHTWTTALYGRLSSSPPPNYRGSAGDWGKKSRLQSYYGIMVQTYLAAPYEISQSGAVFEEQNQNILNGELSTKALLKKQRGGRERETFETASGLCV